MYRYVIKRLLLMIPVVLGVSFVIFSILALVPGDPASMILGAGVTQEEVDQLNHELGYDRPFFVRYFNYLYDAIFRFDFGTSYATRQAVFPEVISKAPISFAIAMIQMN